MNEIWNECKQKYSNHVLPKHSGLSTVQRTSKIKYHEDKVIIRRTKHEQVRTSGHNTGTRPTK